MTVLDFSKQVEKMTEAQVKQLAGTFTVIFLDPAYSNTLHVRLRDPFKTICLNDIILLTLCLSMYRR